MERSLARTSFTLLVLATATSIAMLLGLVGIYAVVADAVTQRTREIGIRVALGAPLREVKRMFIRHAVVLAGLGVLGGSAAAVLLTQLMSSLLFGVSRFDPSTYLAVRLLVLAAAAGARYIPARRATVVSSLEALRA